MSGQNKKRKPQKPYKHNRQPRVEKRGAFCAEKDANMQNLKRNKSINFRVTPEEYEMVKKRMGQTHVTNMRAYLLKMAVDGRVINVEMESIKESNKLLRNISNNVNQIATRANSTGNVYAADIDEIKTRQTEIWERQEEILKKLTKMLEAV